MLNIAICDEDKKSVDHLYYLVAHYLMEREILYKIDVFHNGEQFLQVDTTNYHVVFLSIHLNDMPAVSAAHLIRHNNRHIMMALIVDDPQYSVYGKLVGAIRCIERSRLPAELPDCLETVNNKSVYVHTQNLQEATHTIEMNGLAQEINVQNIYFIESEKRKLRVHTVSKTYEYYEKLNNIEPILRQKGFMRCHQSYLVNSAFVKEVDFNNLQIKMENGQVLPISKSKRGEIEREYLWPFKLSAKPSKKPGDVSR